MVNVRSSTQHLCLPWTLTSPLYVLGHKVEMVGNIVPWLWSTAQPSLAWILFRTGSFTAYLRNRTGQQHTWLWFMLFFKVQIAQYLLGFAEVQSQWIFSHFSRDFPVFPKYLISSLGIQTLKHNRNSSCTLPLCRGDLAVLDRGGLC